MAAGFVVVVVVVVVVGRRQCEVASVPLRGHCLVTSRFGAARRIASPPLGCSGRRRPSARARLGRIEFNRIDLTDLGGDRPPSAQQSPQAFAVSRPSRPWRRRPFVHAPKTDGGRRGIIAKKAGQGQSCADT